MSERLLKARQAGRGGATVPFNFTDLNRQCDEYLAGVRRQAEEILEQAAATAEALCAQAQAEGLEAGRIAGLRDADRMIQERAADLATQQVAEQLQTLLPVLQSTIDALRTERDRWIRDWENSAVRLCAAMAERVVRAHVALRPELTAGMIAEALQLAAGTPRLTLRVHPDDMKQLDQCRHPLLEKLSELGQANVVADSQITRGGCVIETVHGTIDSRVESQIDRIVEELLEGS